jgi:D-alanine transaminase/branched-chain amino acid aminotransferase
VSDGNFVFINDTFVPRERAALHIDDLLVQRGYGIFDFFKTDQGRPVFLDDHLDRFEHSASRMRLPIGKSRDQLKGVLAELLRRNGIPNSGVRLTLTGGRSDDGYSIGQPMLIITQQPLRTNPALASGIRLMTAEHQRQLCDVKSLDYLMPIWLQPLMRERGADDIVYHRGGIVSECPRSNVFIVTRNGKLATPGEGILKGVIRKQVLELAPTQLPVEQRTVMLEELRHAAEVFITSTTKGIVPIVAIDGAPVGAGRVGEVTRSLGAALAERAKAASQALG